MDTPTPTLETMATEARFNAIEAKLDFLVTEAKKAKQSRQITFWLTIAFFVLPLIGVLAMLPSLMSQMSGGQAGSELNSILAP